MPRRHPATALILGHATEHPSPCLRLLAAVVQRLRMGEWPTAGELLVYSASTGLIVSGTRCLPWQPDLRKGTRPPLRSVSACGSFSPSCGRWDHHGGLRFRVAVGKPTILHGSRWKACWTCCHPTASTTTCWKHSYRRLIGALLRGRHGLQHCCGRHSPGGPSTSEWNGLSLRGINQCFMKAKLNRKVWHAVGPYRCSPFSSPSCDGSSSSPS